MLKVRGLDAYYGKAQVLKSVDLDIEAGEAVALLGPNGAGKTTVMLSLSGLVKISGTSLIEFDGNDIAGLKPEKIVQKGLVHVPQGRGVFPGLSLKENLIMGAFLRHDKGIQSDMEKWLEVFPKLKSRLRQAAGTLSGGEQQMLAIMRGLMARPKLLMLDEPSMGLAPIMVEQIYEVIAQIKEQSITVLLVEQNTNMALQITDKAYILSVGQIVSKGQSIAYHSDKQLLESYFSSTH